MLEGTARHMALMLLLSVAAAVMGCETSGEGDDKGATAKLEVLGPEDRDFASAATDTVYVQYVAADDDPLYGVITAELEGRLEGARLDRSTATTDSDGVARFTVTTGQRGDFDLVLSAPSARDVAIIHYRVGVDVTSNPGNQNGTIEYTVGYGGARVVRTVETALFTNATCASLATYVPVAAQAQRTTLEHTDRYDVRNASSIALFAIGVDAYNVATAATCRDVTLTGSLVRERLLLEDLNATTTGAYDLDTTFSVERSTSQNVDQLAYRMTSFMADPARFIVDSLVNDENVDWNLRYWLQRWDVRQQVEQHLRASIESRKGRTYLDALALRSTQVEEALRHVTLDSTLTLGVMTVSGEYAATHRVRNVRLAFGGRTVERAIDASATVYTRVDATNFTMNEHSLPLPLGKVLRTALDGFVSDLGAPTMGDLFYAVVDCTPIEEPSDYCGRSNARFAAVACETAGRNFAEYNSYNLDRLANLADLRFSATGRIDRGTAVEASSNLNWLASDGSLRYVGRTTGSVPGTGTTSDLALRVRDRIAILRP